MTRPVAVDLFAGAGGLSLGLAMAGFDVRFALDFDEHAVSTYRRNLGDHIVASPLEHVSVEDIAGVIQLNGQDLALVAGGPPCQGFSTQRRGSSSDSRNQLALGFVEVACALRPRAIMMENVPGIVGTRGRPLVKSIEKKLSNAGYWPTWNTVDAADFGVPQHRRRAFLVALRNREFHFPVETYSEPLTVRDAISDISPPSSDHSPHHEIANHELRRISELNQRRIAAVPAGGDRRDIPWELQLECHRNSGDHRHLDVYGRMEWDSPAPTITAMFDSFTRGRFAHPDEDRVITNREGARLQGFPDSFVFLGPKKSVARQIGNAVPPPLAHAVARAIRSELDSIGHQSDATKSLAAPSK